MAALSTGLLARAVRRPDMDLFTADNANAALDELQRGGAVIYGSDSFRLEVDGIAPVGTVDVSPGGSTDEFYQSIRRFVSQQPADCLFELVWD